MSAMMQTQTISLRRFSREARAIEKPILIRDGDAIIGRFVPDGWEDELARQQVVAYLEHTLAQVNEQLAEESQGQEPSWLKSLYLRWRAAR